jgi:hypothetical protein
MADDRPTNYESSVPVTSRGIGFGLFLLFAGCVLLAQRFGLLPNGADWFFPIVLIAWGASEIYQRMRRS